MRDILATIEREAARAAEKYGEFTSTHEALGVLLEEFNELQLAIQKNSKWHIHDEATQIAAVALRLADACINGGLGFVKRSNLK